MDVLCRGKNKDGRGCTRHRNNGLDTCRWHHPEMLEKRARAMDEEAKRLREVLA